jgi:hypothetical protein
MNGKSAKIFMRQYAIFSCFFISVAVSLPTFVGCGNGNAFSKLEKRSDKDKGKSALANGDYGEAIVSLEDYLKDNPDDHEARQSLANAYMKKAKMDPLELASKIASAQESNGKNDWQAIVSSMPEGSSENIELFEKAAEVIEAIPADQRTKEQNYQLAIAKASVAVTIVKKVTDDTSGSPSAEKIDQLTEDEAEKVVDNLDGTATALSTAGVGNGSSGAGKLASVSEQIKSQEGASSSEKLKAYLKSKK